MTESLAQDFIYALKNDTLMNIVACTRTKIWDKDPAASLFVPAREAFRGPMFLQAVDCFRMITRHIGEEPLWMILSAKFGLINPDWNMPDYSVHLSSSRSSNGLVSFSEMEEQWDEKSLSRYDTFAVWGPSAYCKQIRELASSRSSHFVRLLCPAEGLGTGKAVGALKKFREEIQKQVCSIYGNRLMPLRPGVSEEEQ